MLRSTKQYSSFCFRIMAVEIITCGRDDVREYAAVDERRRGYRFR